MLALPLIPAQLPTRVEPGKVPSYRLPTPRPLRYLAQSVRAGDHSPTIVQRPEDPRSLTRLQIPRMCWSSVQRTTYGGCQISASATCQEKRTNIVVEDLINVGIQNDPFPARVAHESFPVRPSLERVGNDDDGVARLRGAIGPPGRRSAPQSSVKVG